jgi:hypothetical protein
MAARQLRSARKRALPVIVVGVARRAAHMFRLKAMMRFFTQLFAKGRAAPADGTQRVELKTGEEHELIVVRAAAQRYFGTDEPSARECRRVG